MNGLDSSKQEFPLKPIITEQNNVQQNNPINISQPSVKKPISKNNKTGIIYLVIIIFLLVGLIGTYKYMDNKITQLRYSATPISDSQKEIELDVNSSLVKRLYEKVRTNIREDVAQPIFNDEMKLYLAYRQILEKDKYDSNCNLFSDTSMEPYICEKSSTFEPRAFKIESLEESLKDMYGDNISIPLKNIQLGGKCFIGYQYIPNRGEYVEGYCKNLLTTTFTVNKELIKATSLRNTIILTEKVKYQTKSGKDIPEYLKSGLYKYIFRLDMNYNYVLIDKYYYDQYE